MKAMKRLMAALRTAPPAEIGGRNVLETVDYLGGNTGLIPSDVLEFRLEGGAKLIIRPSGTEPKLKLYLSVCGKSEAQAEAGLAELSAAADGLIVNH